MKILDFNEGKVNLGEALSDVKRMIETDMVGMCRNMLGEVFEKAIGLEFDEFMCIGRYQRKETRKNYRNGYRERKLLTQVGELNLKIPRARLESFNPSCVERYKRVDRHLNRLIRELYLSGVSTRKVEGIMKSLCGCGVSAGYVSNVTKALDEKVKEMSNMPIEKGIVFLFLDGIYVRVKVGLNAQRRVILVAYGVRRDGSRQLISWKIAKKESGSSWKSFLENIEVRGLKGGDLKLIIMDGAPGLWSGVEEVYPLVEKQLCWVHKLRNVSKYGSKKLSRECVQEAAKIMYAGSKGRADNMFRLWKRKWLDKIPKAVECLEKDYDKLVGFFAFDVSMHKMLRTTNVIERCFRELRRRVSPMGGCFQDTGSCNRIICSLFCYFNNKWSPKHQHIKIVEQYYKLVA